MSGSSVVGQICRIIDLESRPELNGTHGTPKAYCEDTGLCQVEVSALNGSLLDINLANLQPLELGHLVGFQCRIVGLSSRSDLNGTAGTPNSYDQQSGRYVVGVELTREWLKLKPVNLELFSKVSFILGTKWTPT